MSGELGAVLFDMDGTLVDTEGLWWQACVEVAAELDLKLTEADAGNVLGRLVEDAAEYLARRAPVPPGAERAGAAEAEAERAGVAKIEAGAERAEVTGTEVEAERAEMTEMEAGAVRAKVTGIEVERVGARLTEAFAERVSRGVTPLPGAIRLLDDLAAEGVPTALVSASPRLIVDMVLHTVGAERFALVVAAEDTARGKPLPDPYLLAASGLGLDPAACVAVEDSPTGLAAARAAGCRVVSVSGDPVAEDVLSVDSLEKVDLPLLRLLASGRRSIG
ncbi:HAD family phosphatase [Streptosporangium sp. NPDC002524]|uniref:HAD family hydrolase n=1 Tax=Streptosporangium sp. NPDC002524 TaxID=3154537 RepID=UPI0033300A9E